MKTILLYFACIFLLALNACEKDKTAPGNANTNSTSAKRLREFRIVTGNDTTTKITYTYDSGNRIATVHRLDYESGSPADDGTYTFEYGTNDSLPSHMRLEYSDYISPSSSETENEYFFYNNLRVLVKDSQYYNNSGGSATYNFEYLTDHIKLTTNFEDTLLSYLVNTNGNVTSETDTLTGAFIQDFFFHLQVSFDDHPNPFYFAGLKRVIYYMPESYIDEGLMPAVKNNILEAVSTPSGSPAMPSHFQYSYTYDSDGYPLTMISNDIINSVTTKGFYTY